MNYIVNIDSKKFSVNGIPYYKNFVPHVIGDSLRIINQYDSSFELVGYSKYNQFTVNGQTFLNVATLQDALLPVLFTRSTLGSSNLPDAILVQTGFSITGTTFKLNAGWVWRIDGITYTNSTDVYLEITLSDLGKVRQDIIQLKVGGVAEIKEGIEVVEFPPKPVPDENCIEATNFPVGDSSVGEPSTPIVGNPYIEKNVYTETTSYAGDGKLFINNSANYILLDPTITEIKGLILGDSSNNFSGRPNFITNKTGHDVTILNNNGSVDIPIILPNSANLVLKNGYTMPLIWSSDGDVEGCLKLVESGYVVASAKSNYNGYVSMSIVSSGTTVVNIGPTATGAFSSGTTSSGGVNVFGIPYLKITSDAAVGSFSNYRQNPLRGIETPKVKLIHESYFGIGNTELLTTIRTLNGFVQYATMGMGNINPSIGAICAFCNDSADSNLQLAYKGQGGSVQKIDLGSDFPARYTVGQHFYKTIIELLGDSKAKASILDLVTGKSWTSPIVDCYHTGGNSFSYVNHMNNNTEAVAVVSLFVGQINRLNYDI